MKQISIISIFTILFSCTNEIESEKKISSEIKKKYYDIAYFSIHRAALLDIYIDMEQFNINYIDTNYIFNENRIPNKDLEKYKFNLSYNIADLNEYKTKMNDRNALMKSLLADKNNYEAPINSFSEEASNNFLKKMQKTTNDFNIILNNLSFSLTKVLNSLNEQKIFFSNNEQVKFNNLKKQILTLRRSAVSLKKIETEFTKLMLMKTNN